MVLHLLSLAMLSVAQKCLDKKCSSSGVGWYGNWCSFSWEEQDDCNENNNILDYTTTKRHFFQDYLHCTCTDPLNLKIIATFSSIHLVV